MGRSTRYLMCPASRILTFLEATAIGEDLFGSAVSFTRVAKSFEGRLRVGLA